MSEDLSGSTAFGPFSILLRDVREVLLHHGDSEFTAPVSLNATLVSESGRRYEVEELRYRGSREFTFQQGRRRRSLDLAKIARVDFQAPDSESRPITITLHSGKTLIASVDANTVRYAGERDSQYISRVDSAFVGQMSRGRLALGLHELRLIILHPPESAAADTSAAPGDTPVATPPQD